MGPQQGQQLSQESLNRIVIEYLAKRGYTRTEAMFRLESAKDSNVLKDEPKAMPQKSLPEDYVEIYRGLKTCIDNSLHIYKVSYYKMDKNTDL